MAWREQTLFVIVVLVTARSAWSQQTYSPSHTTTRFEDAELEEFSYPNAANYTKLVLDSTNNQLLVGAREYIFQISLDNITNFKVISWKSDNNTKKNCKKLSKTTVDECYNFVKEIIVVANNSVLVCGTNAHGRSMCSWREPSDISRKIRNLWTPRIPLNPSPHSNSTGVLSDLDHYYYGRTKLDSSSSLIYSTGFKRSVKTQLSVQGNEILNDPDFVKSFVIGQYIYFFFRETAVENINCGKVRFSRVARICKGDSGGDFMFKKTFVTFMKARLNCSISGKFPFYFNEIQDVYWDEGNRKFYAVFSSQPNGLHGSAVCAYSMNETESVFRGDYKAQKLKGSEWLAVHNEQHFPNCKIRPESLKSNAPSNLPRRVMATRYMKMEVVRYLRSHPLMDKAVAPTTTGAHFVLRGVGFTGVTVDEVGGQTVVYVSTDGGSVLRLFTPSGRPTCILEEIVLYKDDEREVIKTLRINNSKGALYVGSNRRLVKLKLERCERHRNRKSCVEAHDPYCVWSLSRGACVSRRSVTDADSWSQDLSKCPLPKAKWSRWTEWKACEQHNGNVCRCRTRSCLNTRNATECEGSALQLANCTVVKGGDWSLSSWLLEGVIHGGWGAWSNWTACSGIAGSKSKHRGCNKPAPRNGGAPCFGHTIKIKHCRLKPQVKSKEMWTSYVRMAEKRNTAIRFLFHCTASGGEVTNVRLAVSDNSTIDCTKSGKNCYGYEPGSWSKWKDWGPCETVGRKYRTRACSDRDKPCIGWNREERECVPARPTPEEPHVATQTTHTTVGTDTNTRGWGWGSWSPCSCTDDIKLLNASMGIRHRVPRCRDSCQYNIDCPKDKVEYQMCACGRDPNTVDVGARKSDTPQSRRTKYELIGWAVAGVVLFIVVCLVVSYFVVRRKKNFNVSKTHEKSLHEDSSSEKYYAQNNYPSVSSTKSNGNYSVELKEKTPFISLFTRNAKDRAVFKSAQV